MIMILLDTCTLLWLAADQDRLSSRAIEAIAASTGGLFVSSIAAFEIAVKTKKGKLELPLQASEWHERVLKHHGIKEIPIGGAIAARGCLTPTA